VLVGKDCSKVDDRAGVCYRLVNLRNCVVLLLSSYVDFFSRTKTCLLATTDSSPTAAYKEKRLTARNYIVSSLSTEACH
jgi:hypothetical protein